jgi:hypothetical protein
LLPAVRPPFIGCGVKQSIMDIKRVTANAEATAFEIYYGYKRGFSVASEHGGQEWDPHMAMPSA